MMNNIYRHKLVNAVVFFALKVRRLNTTKLSKLLFYFDFRHFQQTGRPAIGLRYYAYPQGPLPTEFWRELIQERLPEDLASKITVIEEKTGITDEYVERRIVKRHGAKFENNIFTPRELSILDDLILIFGSYDAKTYSKASHEYDSPWDLTRRLKEDRELIDYMLAIQNKTDIDQENANEELIDHFSVKHNFKIEPTDR